MRVSLSVCVCACELECVCACEIGNGGENLGTRLLNSYLNQSCCLDTLLVKVIFLCNNTLFFISPTFKKKVF